MIELEPGETIYSRAADEIDRRGWIQGWFEAFGGAVCLLGGVQCGIWGMTCDHLPEDVETGWQEYSDAVGELFMYLNTGPSTWNDEPGRTKEEVLKVLREMHERTLAHV